jgi:hypothetical protein
MTIKLAFDLYSEGLLQDIILFIVKEFNKKGKTQ